MSDHDNEISLKEAAKGLKGYDHLQPAVGDTVEILAHKKRLREINEAHAVLDAMLAAGARGKVVR